MNMNDFTPVFKRDVTVGVLGIVISLFFMLAAYKFASEPSVLIFIGIYFSVLVAQGFFNFGLSMIKGIVVLVEKKDK